MTADTYLRQWTALVSRIETLDRRLREIDMMYGHGSLTADLSSERVSHTANVYKMEDDVVRMSQLKDRYSQELVRCTIRKQDIEDLIDTVPDGNARHVLKEFYIHDGLKQPSYLDISVEMSVSYSYVMKLRRKGLQYVQSVLDSK